MASTQSCEALPAKGDKRRQEVSRCRQQIGARELDCGYGGNRAVCVPVIPRSPTIPPILNGYRWRLQNMLCREGYPYLVLDSASGASTGVRFHVSQGVDVYFKPQEKLRRVYLFPTACTYHQNT